MNGNNKILRIAYVISLVIFLGLLAFSMWIFYIYLFYDNENSLNVLTSTYIPLTILSFIIFVAFFITKKIKKIISDYSIRPEKEILIKKIKKRISIFLAVLIVILFLAPIVVLFWGSSITCSALMMVLPAAKEEGFHRPVCEVQSVSNQKNRTAYILHYSGTEAQDCASGCFYSNISKIFDPKTFKIYDFNLFSRIFKPTNGKLNLPQGCGSTQNNSVSLYKDKDIFYWKYEFLPHAQDWKYGCEVSGFYIYNGNGLYQDATSYKHYSVDCNNREQAKKYLDVSGVDTYGDVIDRCFYYMAVFQKRCDLCDYVKKYVIKKIEPGDRFFDYKTECQKLCKAVE